MEKRRVRFESIEGLQRGDLDLAGEIWLRDICAARWATPAAMKLAAHLVRYMASPDQRRLTLGSLEHQLMLTKDEVAAALKVLRLYRAIEDYVIETEGLTAALRLSTLQRLQVLEVRQRLAILGDRVTAEPAPRASRWLPPVSPDQDDADPAPNRSPADASAIDY